MPVEELFVMTLAVAKSEVELVKDSRYPAFSRENTENRSRLTKAVNRFFEKAGFPADLSLAEVFFSEPFKYSTCDSCRELKGYIECMDCIDKGKVKEIKSKDYEGDYYLVDVSRKYTDSSIGMYNEKDDLFHYFWGRFNVEYGFVGPDVYVDGKVIVLFYRYLFP